MFYARYHNKPRRKVSEVCVCACTCHSQPRREERRGEEEMSIFLLLTVDLYCRPQGCTVMVYSVQCAVCVCVL